MLSFELTPPVGDAQDLLVATAQVGDQTVATEMETINYPHIPPQVLFPRATAKLVRSDVRLLAEDYRLRDGRGRRSAASPAAAGR